MIRDTWYYNILIASPPAALWGRLKTCAPVGNRRPSDAPNYSISSPPRCLVAARAAVWGGPPGPQPAPRCLQNQKLRNEPNALRCDLSFKCSLDCSSVWFLAPKVPSCEKSRIDGSGRLPCETRPQVRSKCYTIAGLVLDFKIPATAPVAVPVRSCLLFNIRYRLQRKRGVLDDLAKLLRLAAGAAAMRPGPTGPTASPYPAIHNKAGSVERHCAG